MKFNTILMTTALTVSSMFTMSAHADNSTRIAATSALGSVVGTAVGLCCTKLFLKASSVI